MVQLESDCLRALDEAAEAEGVSRAALARRAIHECLAERRRRAELQRVIDVLAADPPEDLALPRSRLQDAWPD